MNIPKPQNLTILIMICLMVSFSSLSRATTFFLAEDPDSPPPHNVGDEFNCEIRIDATTASGSENPLNLQPIKAIGIYLTFDNTKITPVNAPPFTLGNYLPDPKLSGENTLVAPNGLKLEVAHVGIGTGGSRLESNGLIATVRFRQIVAGIAPAAFGNVGTETYYTAGDDLTQIEPTVVGKDLSLPVSLSKFDAAFVEHSSQVIINWRTETEVNNVGFSIYRSGETDGNYTKIGFVNGAGSSAMSIDYQFTDKKVEQGKTYFYYLQDVDVTGEKRKSEIIKVVTLPTQPVPKDFQLLQNFPNPFNPETWIPYKLPFDGQVMVRIYNMHGNLVRTMDVGKKATGVYISKDKAAYWDGKDNAGERVSSGIYFYQLQAGNLSATRRMVIVK